MMPTFGRTLVLLLLLPGFHLLAVDATWISRAPVPNPRQEVGVAQLDGKVYLVGGLPRTNAMAEYDPSTDTWRARAPLPIGVDHTAVAAVAGKLYVAGGNTDSGPTNALFEYDPATDRWAAKAPMPTARDALAAAALDGRIYVVGGGSATQRELEVYDPATNQWTTRAPMPTGRNHLAAGIIGVKLYVAGGRNASSFTLAALEVYDPATNTWAARAPMPTGRSGHAGAVADNRFYTFGGEGNAGDPTGVFEDVEVYDAASDTWKKLDPMPTPRHGVGAVAIGNRIYVPAGATRAGLGPQSAVNEVLVAQPEKLYFAHVASGPGITSEVTVANLSETEANLVTIEVLGPQGQVGNRSAPILPPLGSQRIAVSEALPFSGWALVSAERRVTGSVLYRSTIPGFSGVAGVPASAPLTRFLVPVQTTPGGTSMGLALNTVAGAVTVTLVLRGLNGAPLATRQLNLPADGHVAMFLDQIFPAVLPGSVGFSGSVTGTSTAPIAAVALLFTGSEFAALPVTAY